MNDESTPWSMAMRRSEARSVPGDRAGDVRLDPQQQLSVAQVASLLQCSERWLYGKIRAGELRATHLGRAVRISRANLQVFLDAQQAWTPPSRRAAS